MYARVVASKFNDKVIFLTTGSSSMQKRKIVDTEFTIFARNSNFIYLFCKKKGIVLPWANKRYTCLSIHQSLPPVLPHKWKPEHMGSVVQRLKYDIYFREHGDLPHVPPQAWKPEHAID
jgi:hypothetical protein